MPGTCFRCKDYVHAAEERLALDSSWHFECFTCAICNKTLDSRILYECRIYNEIYCKACYKKHFCIQGYGYGPTDPTLVSHETCEEKAEKCHCIECTCIKPSTAPHEQFISPPSRQGHEYLQYRPPPKHYTHQAVRPTPRRCERKCEEAHQNPDSGYPRGCLCYRDEVQSTTGGECVRNVCVVGPIERSKGCRCNKNRTWNDFSARTPQVKMGTHGPLCMKCGREVFYAEKVQGYRGVYHTRCFNCYRCRKSLDSTTVNEHNGELYCKGCYKHLYATSGVGYGIGAGTLQTP